ncbi:hypothetical protein CGRA01v4_02374 [Colletotrichum graminicola]|uniref:Uncharacterized protein n=1 Tax=Colletotrichum graminicola (strain M1.001 / M2 / FGSC 10212) TaxID=645133 RepID=E3Q3J3_COLGM|nr:uncharacterized protein GLRG_00739 [Colletotrichum graminicola M1.001]EFQ25595.1 hypothetical protein GLRG_00739 [Colletotrichum graminicola M1.001]WDK11095.1 hypothetical protein CGRA01v4_02374 [Colletotrichum graminicola]
MTGSHSTQWTEVYLSHSISLSHNIPRHAENTTQHNCPASLSRHHQMPFQRAGLIQQSFAFALFIPTFMTSIQTNYWTWSDEDEQRRRIKIKKRAFLFFFSSYLIRFYGTWIGMAFRTFGFLFYFFSPV